MSMFITRSSASGKSGSGLPNVSPTPSQVVTAWRASALTRKAKARPRPETAGGAGLGGCHDGGGDGADLHADAAGQVEGEQRPEFGRISVLMADRNQCQLEIRS